MTSEREFRRMLAKNPNDWNTRLVFADWLQDRGDPRAEGYRVMALLRLAPWRWGPHMGSAPKKWFWLETITGKSNRCNLKSRWFNKLPESGFKTRREAEDAAAWAFAQMRPEWRADFFREATKFDG